MATEADRLEALARRLALLEDREAIRDCLWRYCRGIDRADEAALRSAYWPDATDRHGPYQGTASGFVDWALQAFQRGPRNVHLVGNIAIELRGDQAAVESYFHALQGARAPGQPANDMLLCGRYIDRFERREGAWRVAERVVAYDWVQPLANADERGEAERFGVRQPIGAKAPDDPWYALLARLPAA